MFQENPFSGACAYAVWEVLLMLVGTLLLGLLLGYLIWGWTRRKLREVEAHRDVLKAAKSDLRKQLEELTATSGQQQEELDAINEVNSSQRRQLSSLTVTNRNLKKQFDELTEAAQESKSDRDKSESTLTSYNEKISDLEKQLTDSQAQNADLKTRVKKLRKGKEKARGTDSESLERIQSDKKTTQASPESIRYPDPFATDAQTEKEPAPEPEILLAASEIFGKDILNNDLALVEGIGPKIAEVLRNGGITSWEKLSNTTRHILRVILDEAGPKFHGHKPKTWPRQARMAANGEWKKLKAYQDILNAGK